MKSLMSLIVIPLAVSGLTFSLYAQEGFKGNDDHFFEGRNLDAIAVNVPPVTIQTVANYDVKWYRCQWNIDPAVRAISGSVTCMFSPLDQGLNGIELKLHPDLTVDSIKYHGALVEWETHIYHLFIFMPSPPQSIDSVTVFYHGIPPLSSSFVKSSHDGTPIIWTFSLLGTAADWWPCKPDLRDKADSIDIYINTPSAYRTATVGTLVSETVSGDNTVYHWKHRYPIANYVINVAVTNYVVYTHQVPIDGQMLDIYNYVYPEDSAELSAKTGILVPAMQLFDSLFGIYPFQNEKYGQAQYGAGYGMENQTMSFLSNFSYIVMTHELAHAWFGNKLTCGSWTDVWLNEGFAVYLTGLCYENFKPEENHTRLTGFIDNITRLPDGSVYCPDSLNMGRIFDHRLSYEKGAMILHQLRWIMGDSAFFAALRNYVNDPDLVYGFASTSDLKEHLESSSGKDLSWYFDDWFTGQGYPIYSVNIVQSQDYSASITINQSQSHGSVSFFEMPVPVQFFGTERDTTIIFNNTFSGQTFEINPNFAITSTKFDPDIWLIKKYSQVLVGMDDYSASKILTIYPNPVKDKFIIESSDLTENANLSIFNSNGSKVMERQIPEINTEIDVSMLPVGLYFLKLENGKLIETGKIVRE